MNVLIKQATLVTVNARDNVRANAAAAATGVGDLNEVGGLANEDLEARLFIERLAGMATVSTNDTQAVAPNEHLELYRKYILRSSDPTTSG